MKIRITILALLCCVGCGQHNTAKPWPRQENGSFVVKTMSFKAELYLISTLPTRVPDNHLLKFRILDETVGADYYFVPYPRFREKNPELEKLFKNRRVNVVLTVDAIAVNPRTKKNFGGITEYRHDDGTLLIGDLKKITVED